MKEEKRLKTICTFQPMSDLAVKRIDTGEYEAMCYDILGSRLEMGQRLIALGGVHLEISPACPQLLGGIISCVNGMPVYIHGFERGDLGSP